MKHDNKKRVKIQRPPILTAKTQKLVATLQKELDLPLLVYWVSTGGSICQNDVIAMSRLLRPAKKQSKVALFLKSDGGNPEAALRFVHLLRQKFDKVTLLAPFECASAATMVALGANEIHMGPTSYLTAVDSSLKHDLSPVDHHNYLVSVSQDEVMRILRLWKEQKSGGNPFPEVYKYLHPLVLGALDRSSSLSMRICRELLSYHVSNPAKAMKISRALNYDYPSHSYPITAHEARRLGLNVRDLDPAVDTLLRDLNHVYAEMAHAKNTDYDTLNYHNGEICNILETVGRQVFYQVDKDWHYRAEEKRWVPMNDQSGWYLCTQREGKWTPEKFFIR
jgi:Serine dehydrogenase proteinase